ncbi:MAG: response regulator [Proteobacteria bacterium]|nr:response regulator [Pseudomonadota bacterium]MBU1388468.1 response regulator [Pseudomonadota bacterium]MBU1542708.1 response regulator [Pseudomonadota bacterium]MBU2430856.1 response regulator [Pseudomonadota bacterium]MBU2481242.1 response regulator [Pseudomonadota bacterium]
MKKILIIDDEEVIRKFLRLFFEKNGYEVVEAVNGVQGVRVFKAQGAELIITDLVMPEQEGLETIREIVSISSGTPIIAMSGGGVIDPEIYLKMAKGFGAKYVFPKPFDKDLLLEKVRELLQE